MPVFQVFFRSEIVEQFHEIFGEWPAPKIVAVEENEGAMQPHYLPKYLKYVH